MWPWKRQRPVADLEERQDRVERQMRDLRADWDSTFEKFAKLNARLAKRAKREMDAAEAEKTAEDAPESTNGDHSRVTDNPLAARLLDPYRGLRR